MTTVQAIIDGPVDTPYHGGKFRVQVSTLWNSHFGQKNLNPFSFSVIDIISPKILELKDNNKPQNLN
jgi:hypothetical protein